MKIQIIPYNQIKNQSYINGEILITNELFDTIEYHAGKSTFSFLNCRFKKLTIRNTSIIHFNKITISFSYCQIQEIEISEIESKNIGIYCHGCIIQGKIKNGNLESFQLNNCFTPSLFLLNQNNINISYTEENIFVKSWKKLIEPINVKSVEDLLNLRQDINIFHSKDIRFSFSHNRTERTGVFREKYNQFEEWKIRYHLTDEQKKSLRINVNIDFSNQLDELLKIENCTFNSLSLKGNANGKILIENSSINNFFIRDFSSESDTLLYNIYPLINESKLEIHKSNMDNTWFDNIDFNGYKSLSFYRTRFANAAFTSCNFPEDNLSFEKFNTLENIHYPDNKSQNYYKDQYETFLQLKTSLENSGNYYEAQKVGAISKESLRKISTLSKWDKLILWTYAKSNNHGLSVKKPLIGLFGFSILFYVLYLLSIERIFNSNEIDWTLVGHYFSFMDLTHKQDFLVSKEEFTFWTLTIDFANKLIVGFFLFQFVSAFRKYVKK